MIGEQLSVRVACLVSVLVLGAPAADAQPVADEQGTSATSAKRKCSLRFGGPSSVSGTIRRDKRVKPFLATYFDFKERLEKDRGLEYGFDYLPIYQGGSESLGERHAADGVVRPVWRYRLDAAQPVLGTASR